ncbi:MAG: DUF3991 domain-containing protein [Oscillospiraceae bacterium]
MENKYFAELARRLRAAGITAGHPEKNRLTVLLNNQPVLSVSAGSDVFLLPAGSNQPEAGELYHKVAQTADEVYAYGLSYPEAMIRLLGGEQGVVYEASPRKEEPEPKEFALPPAGESMRRVYAYLLKQRFISREVLNTFVSQRLIYESCEKSKDNTKEYHNAVFVGFDEHGVPRHAHKDVFSYGEIRMASSTLVSPADRSVCCR